MFCRVRDTPPPYVEEVLGVWCGTFCTLQLFGFGVLFAKSPHTLQSCNGVSMGAVAHSLAMVFASSCLRWCWKFRHNIHSERRPVSRLLFVVLTLWMCFWIVDCGFSVDALLGVTVADPISS